jgi:hypothetical protein
LDIVNWHVCHLAYLSFVIVKINGFWRLSGAVEILDFDTFEPLKSYGDGYHVSYASTLKMTSRMLVLVSYELRYGRQREVICSQQQEGILNFNLLGLLGNNNINRQPTGNSKKFLRGDEFWNRVQS